MTRVPTVTQVMSITNFGIPETVKLFAEDGLTTFEVIAFNKVVNKAREMGNITPEEEKLVLEWLKTPWTWAAMHGKVASGPAKTDFRGLYAAQAVGDGLFPAVFFFCV